MAHLFGWTVEQFGAAKAMHSRLTGSEAKPTAQGAVEIKRWWMANRMDEPLECTLIGTSPEIDREWACQVLASTPCTAL